MRIYSIDLNKNIYQLSVLSLSFDRNIKSHCILTQLKMPMFRIVIKNVATEVYFLQLYNNEHITMQYYYHLNKC